MQQKQGGFTMLIAVVTGTILLLVSFGMASIALRQQVLASGARDSQIAFYAADSGLECALYLDQKIRAFATTTPFNADVSNYCGSSGTGISKMMDYPMPSGFVSTSTTFMVQYDKPVTSGATPPGLMCTVVQLTKSRYTAPSTGTVFLKTTVSSHGYNTCDASARRLERAVQAVYYESI